MLLLPPTLLCLLAANSAIAHPAVTAVLSKSELPTGGSDDVNLAFKKFEKLADLAASNTRRSPGAGGSCTPSTLLIRREWYGSHTVQCSTPTDESHKERLVEERTKDLRYCCAVSPEEGARAPAELIPCAISRFDDWVGTSHQSNHVYPFQWQVPRLGGGDLTDEEHRYYTWAYEQALRTECGYTGSQPYWDWAQTGGTGLEKSPLCDGSATSLSGNGAYIPGSELGNISILTASGSNLLLVYFFTARGGGCVASGPFKDSASTPQPTSPAGTTRGQEHPVSVNLGSVLVPLPNGTVLSTGPGFAPNPRYLKRDLTSPINRAFANASSIATTILSNPNIASFQTALQGVPGSGNIGVHGGGHYTLGGDPGRDFYVPPRRPGVLRAPCDDRSRVVGLAELASRDCVWGRGDCGHEYVFECAAE